MTGYSQMEWGRTPFCTDATWRPLLQWTDSQTLCWQNALTTLSKLLREHCTMFPNFLSLNENQKKNLYLSRFIQHSIRPALRGLLSQQTELNKQGRLFDCKMKKGTFRTSVKKFVGGSTRVCLLSLPGHWWFVSGGDHETSHISGSFIRFPPF